MRRHGALDGRDIGAGGHDRWRGDRSYDRYLSHDHDRRRYRRYGSRHDGHGCYGSRHDGHGRYGSRHDGHGRHNSRHDGGGHNSDCDYGCYGGRYRGGDYRRIYRDRRRHLWGWGHSACAAAKLA